MARNEKMGLDDFFAAGATLADARLRIVDSLPGPTSVAPAWPRDILPEPIEAYAVAQARSIGVPLEMVVVPLLVFGGSMIGNGVALQLKRGWSEEPTLWAGVVAAPGEKKSPSLRAAQRPLQVIQQRLAETWKREMAGYEAAHQAWKDSPNAERGEEPAPPRLEHVYTTDVTMEKLVEMLSDNAGIAIILDELAGFVASFDSYRGGRGGDRPNYLSLWAGQSVKVDRKTGPTVYAEHPVASIYGGVQPDRVRDLHNRNGQRDGMVERFLLFWPEVTRRGWTDDEVAPALLDPVVAHFASLRASSGKEHREQITVELHPDARAELIAWFDANDEAVANATGLRQGFYAKLASQLARIALILHCFHHPDDPTVLLDETTMRAAIDIVEFFRAHLDRVLPLLEDTHPDGLTRLPARVMRALGEADLQDVDGWVGRTDLLKKLNCPADELTQALEDLERRGRVERRTVPSATRPSEQWRIRPPAVDIEKDDLHVSKNSNVSSRSVVAKVETSNSSNSWTPTRSLVNVVAMPVTVTASAQAPITTEKSFASAPEMTTHERAENWLTNYLKGGMKSATEVYQAAANVGIVKATLREVAEDRDIFDKWQDPKSTTGPVYWRLVHQPPVFAGAAADNPVRDDEGFSRAPSEGTA